MPFWKAARSPPAPPHDPCSQLALIAQSLSALQGVTLNTSSSHLLGYSGLTTPAQQTPAANVAVPAAFICLPPHGLTYCARIRFHSHIRQMHMTFTDRSDRTASITSPQFLHREAASQLERSAKHHRHAALLHDAGDAHQADIQANIAYVSATQALADSERALKVTVW
jgi:hypothetical protein